MFSKIIHTKTMVKRLLLSSWFFIFSLMTFAQESTLEYSVRLKNLQRQSMANVEVQLVEKFTREVITKKTDATGFVKFKLVSGKLWQMNILRIRNYYMWEVPMPKFGNSTLTRTITYNYKKYVREMRPPINRKQLNIKEIPQAYDATTKFTKTKSLVKISFKKGDKSSPLVNYPVRLTSIKQAKTYTTKTNEKGIAYFLLPINDSYDIDMEDVDNFKYVDVPNRTGYVMRSLIFEPYHHPEKVKGDTIIQSVSQEVKIGTSTRQLLSGTFMNEQDQLLANRKIYLHELNGNRIYQATTNSEGIAKFMLRKGKKYGVLQYKTGNINVYKEILDLTRSFGIAYINKHITIPNASIVQIPKSMQVFVPQRARDLNTIFERQGIDFKNFKNQSIPYYAPSFLVYNDKKNLIGIEKGFLLTSGSVWNAFGENNSSSKSTINSFFVANSLIPKALHLENESCYDPCILTFEIQPKGKTLILEYIFASEEYSEYTDFDDSFGIFIEGQGFDKTKNWALLPDGKTRLSVANVNHKQNASLFQSNEKPTESSFKIWQYDGFSKKIQQRIAVNPNQAYQIKLLIFDRRDSIYDSGVFIGLRSE